MHRGACSCQIVTPFDLCIMHCTSHQLGSRFVLKVPHGLRKEMYTQYSSTEVLLSFSSFLSFSFFPFSFFFPFFFFLFSFYLFFSLFFFLSPFFFFFFHSQPKRVASSGAVYIVLFMHLAVEHLCSKKAEDLQPLIPFTFDVSKKCLKYQYIYWT